MKLSIIMRTFDRLEYTIRSIISIDENCGLPKDQYEIICVDQNSADGTNEWLHSVSKDGYYPIVPVLLSENVGDGRGMNYGVSEAKGEFLAQHDNDIVLLSRSYYSRLISIYKKLEEENLKVCAVGGSHYQGVDYDSAPRRFARKRYDIIKTKCFLEEEYDLVFSSWVTASFIFRREFSELEFNKGMTNSWCGEWWDRGNDNFLVENLKFWHIDSGETGAHVQRQAEKFPNYSYVRKHYKPFIKN